jgi:DNA-binding transcriptional regulator GbsR (MarR family)
MELETLFTDQKWNILKSLSFAKYSPLQLAQRSKTSMANISQQLRLLEAFNLVKKEKIKNRDRGKPRTLFSLSNDHAYIVTAFEGFAGKRLLQLDNLHKILLRAWFLQDQKQRHDAEKFIWAIEDKVNFVDFIAVQISSNKMIIGLEKSTTLKIKKEIQSPEIDVFPIEDLREQAKKKKGIFSQPQTLHILYDRLNIFKMAD